MSDDLNDRTPEEERIEDLAPTEDTADAVRGGAPKDQTDPHPTSEPDGTSADEVEYFLS